MLDYPKTVKEAKKYKYNTWAGNPDGRPYCKGYCAYSVHHNFLFAQCLRKNGHGPANLYCKQHAKIIGEG